MLIQFDDGRELQICRGSFAYSKDATGRESYREWQDLSAEDMKKFGRLVDDLNGELTA